MAKRMVVVLVAVGLAIGACGGDDDEPPPAGAGSGTEGGEETADAEVTAVDFQFDPATIEVAAGTTVTWTNGDEAAHTVTADEPEEGSGGFDEPLPAGGSAEVTFDDAGTFAYFCSIHPTMTGEVVVS